MRCTDCHRRLRPLFTSLVCDYCDGLIEVEYHRGYIVLRTDEELGARPVYVFRTRSDAARWRAANDLRRFRLHEVLSEKPFRWRKSQGAVPDLDLAERQFEIFADHRFEPGPYRAFLAPGGRKRAA